LRKGKFVGTVNVADVSKEELSEMMLGRKVNFIVEKPDKEPGRVILDVAGLTVKGKTRDKPSVNNASFNVRSGEIVCIAGIDGNGQRELVFALSGMIPVDSGTVKLHDRNITACTVRQRGQSGMAHIPEDRQKHGLVLDYNLANNLVLQTYYLPRFQRAKFLRNNNIIHYAEELIDRFDIRSGQGATATTRAMSGGNQQKAVIARETDRDADLLIAVQPTRGLDAGAIEYIHSKLVAERTAGRAVLLISLELDEVMNLSDRILVIYEGEIVADLNPKDVDYQELGLYMSGSKRQKGGVSVT
jgi:simple sugar transport system ATP-binding protein